MKAKSDGGDIGLLDELLNKTLVNQTENHDYFVQ